MTLAPIVLFTYNRPWHTEQTLNALMLNELADKSTLYIYCDGAGQGGTKKDYDKISQVRTLVRKKQWCKNVHFIEHKENQGLANNIVNGVTTILEKYDKVIVLEDDIVTSKYFLSYMNFSLNYYKDEERVFHINAYNNQSNLQFILDDYYFLRFMFCWGWGTWKDRWKKLDKDYTVHYNKLIKNENLKFRFNYGDKMKFEEQLIANINNQKKTWAVLWNCSIFFNDGYCLTPKKSFVLNIGLDGTGENCIETNLYDIEIIEKIKPFKGNIKILEKYKSRLHLKLFFEFGTNFQLHKFLIRTLKKQFN